MESVKRHMGEHVVGLAGEIYRVRERWQNFGTVNRTTGEFEFFPSWLLEPAEVRMTFMKKLVHTQSFVQMVAEKRGRDKSLSVHGREGVFIAWWCWGRWRKRGAEV